MTLRTSLTSHPTQMMRLILNDTYLHALAGNKVIEVWPCQPVAKNTFETLSQTEECTLEIPVGFTFRNKSLNGFLNPSTLVISHFGTPTPCDHAPTITLVIFGKSYTYNWYTGSFKRSGVLYENPLSITTPVDNFDEMIPDLIFKPVMLYNWQDLAPNSSLGALWHTLYGNRNTLKYLAEVFEEIPADDGTTDPSSFSLISNPLTWFTQPLQL